MSKLQNGYPIDRRQPDLEAYNNLAKAIVIDACEDYLNAKRYIYRYNRYARKRKPTKKMEKSLLKHQRELEEAKLFLTSDRCVLYTGGIDGKRILKHLDERIV